MADVCPRHKVFEEESLGIVSILDIIFILLFYFLFVQARPGPGIEPQPTPPKLRVVLLDFNPYNIEKLEEGEFIQVIDGRTGEELDFKELDEDRDVHELVKLLEENSESYVIDVYARLKGDRLNYILRNFPPGKELTEGKWVEPGRCRTAIPLPKR